MKPLTMVHLLRSRVTSPGRVARGVAVVIALGCAATLCAADPPVHYEHSDSLPPGAIGNAQLLRGGPLPGYFQPVEILAPRGAVVSTSETGGFAQPKRAPLSLGLLIGSVYRLRVTNIPGQPGMEVYPTIEVINRLYPPIGMEYKFPIPIELTEEELVMAIDGKFVTRVIYLEEPEAALPVALKPTDQSYFEAAEGENPLDVADSLGRPMAILRMGGRLPDAGGPDERFLFGSPPLVIWKPAVPATQPAPQFDTDSTSNIGRTKLTSGTTPRRPQVVRGMPTQ